ncbi:hypothetical protein, partial [Hydrogenophaga intermedia]|uniref:hypothetical protein n=1 Tax=Hydrogenophaga intermedia TaxID=65786 RepID=UPI001C3F2E9D
RWCCCFFTRPLPDAINGAVPMHGARDHIRRKNKIPYREGSSSGRVRETSSAARGNTTSTPQRRS